MQLTLQLLEGELVILRMPSGTAVPSWVRYASGPLLSVTHTNLELSIICPAEVVPQGVACEAQWREFKVQDPLPFSAVGILASILEPLAAAGISILSISTFDTDYVLVRDKDMATAKDALTQRFVLVE